MAKADRKNDSFRTTVLFYCLVVLLLLLSSALTGARLWGFNWYGYFSWYGPVLLFVASILVLLLLGRRRSWIGDMVGDQSEISASYWVMSVAFVVVSGLAFVLLSARTHFLGDGYLVISRLESGGVANRTYNEGVYYLLDHLYRWLGGSGNDKAELAYRIVSWTSGILFLFVAALTSARLYVSTRQRMLFLCGLGTGGYALLFFGYAENYPLFVLAVSACTFLGLLAITGKCRRWWVLVPVAASVVLHPFFVALIPGVLFVLLKDTEVVLKYKTLSENTRRLIWLFIALATGGSFLWAYSDSLFLKLSVVPLVANRFTVEGYTMFSGKHLLDFTNLLFLLVPGLPILLYYLTALRKNRLFSHPEYAYLALTITPSLLIAFVFDPKLGMPRDWDVFAFAGPPVVTLFLYTILDQRNKIRGYAAVATLSICLGVLVLAPRVLSQVIPNTSIAVFDSYSELDIIKNGPARFLLLQYLEKNNRSSEAASRGRSNTRLSPHQQWDREGQTLLRDGKVAQAMTKFRKVVDYAPNFASAWTNLGVCYGKMNQWDSALAYFEVSDGLNPLNSDTYNSIGYAFSNLGNLEQAEEYFAEAIRLRQANFTARANLANLYRKQTRKDELAKLLVAIVDLPDVPPEAYYESADQLLTMDEIEAARRVCRRAIETGSDSSMIRQLEIDHPGFVLDTTVR